MKHYWKLGLATAIVLAIAATAAGIVAAQTGGSTPDATSTEPKSTATAESDAARPDSDSDATPTDRSERRDEFLDQLADNLGVSREALDSALSQAANDMVDKALADGKITQNEADRIKERIASGDFPILGGLGFRHGFHKGFGMGICIGANLDDLAEFLGVENLVIREGLMNDQSLAQIAEANGKSRDELKSYLTSNVEEKLNQAVADGGITQSDADNKLQNFKDNLDDLIDHTGSPFRGGPGFPGRFHNDDGNDDSSTPGNNTQTSSLTL